MTVVIERKQTKIIDKREIKAKLKNFVKRKKIYLRTEKNYLYQGNVLDLLINEFLMNLELGQSFTYDELMDELVIYNSQGYPCSRITISKYLADLSRIFPEKFSKERSIIPGKKGATVRITLTSFFYFYDGSLRFDRLNDYCEKVKK